MSNATQNASQDVFSSVNASNTNVANELASLTAQIQRSTVQVTDGYGGSGSGVIWNANRIVITNAHVIRRDLATVTLSDNRVFDALAIARDPRLDLVALQLRQNVGDLPHAIAANSENLRVGELVLAVGNPLGMVGALNTGIVTRVPNDSNYHKNNSNHTNTSYGNFERQQWIVSDVQLAPGNSGGLLADARGRAIGINTMVANEMALAIPSNTVEEFLLSLRFDRSHISFPVTRYTARRFRNGNFRFAR
jgi:serine protease Do